MDPSIHAPPTRLRHDVLISDRPHPRHLGMVSGPAGTEADPVLILGAGFAGFWAALAAKRVGREALGVVMVAPRPVLEMRPRLYEARPDALGVDLLPLLRAANVEFVAGEAAALDRAGHRVLLRDGSALPYARLVVATGSRMRRPLVPGATEAYAIDTQSEAVAFDRRLAQLAAGRDATIAIVGAGFTGIELALELRDRVAGHGNRALADAMRIVLLDRADVVGAELGAGPRAVIEAALRTGGIDVSLGVTVTTLSARHVGLAGGRTLHADAVVLSTGMAAAPFAEQVPGRHDPLGRVVVDAYLRAPEAPEIFVTGDAAAARTGDATDHVTLQSCQHALQLGRFAGENAARDLLGLPLRPYAQPRYVTCLDLGRAGAVLTEGWERRVRVTGDEAKALKRRINTVVIYPPAHVAGEVLLGLSDTDPARQRLPDATPACAAWSGARIT